jgi:hypothetical protein
VAAILTAATSIDGGRLIGKQARPRPAARIHDPITRDPGLAR